METVFILFFKTIMLTASFLLASVLSTFLMILTEGYLGSSNAAILSLFCSVIFTYPIYLRLKREVSEYSWFSFFRAEVPEKTFENTERLEQKSSSDEYKELEQSLKEKKATEQKKEMDTKTCPFCAEEDLKLNAKVCKHCHKTLPIEPTTGVKIFVTLVGAGIMFMLLISIDSARNKTQKNETQANESVRNSPWDASVYQVKNYLKKTAKDPDSLEFIEWSEVAKLDNGNFMVRAKYRGKNSFGGYTIENTIFYLDPQGKVINTSNFNK